VAAAGGAGVVTGVLVRRLGHYQSTLCPLRSFLILQTDSTSSTVKVESSGIFIPLDVGGRRGEQPDGAGEADGAARLHEHRGLGVDDCSCREDVEPEAEVYLGLRVDLTLVVTFVCHSCQINAEDPVISGRRVTNRHASVAGECDGSAGENHRVNSSPYPGDCPVPPAPHSADQSRRLSLHT